MDKSTLKQPAPLNAKDALQAKRILERYTNEDTFMIQAGNGATPEPIELPAGVVDMLMEILNAMATGQAVTLVPEETELSTVEAANLLNVSRPYLIDLLESGEIPYRKVGSHRRVRAEDVLHYKAAIDKERERVLDELVTLAQEDDMGYGKP